MNFPRLTNNDSQARDRRRYKAILAATTNSTYSMSPDWSEMRELKGSGFLVDTTGPTKTWLRRYILEEDQPFVQRVIQEAVRNRAVFELEHRVLLANGSIGWTHSRAVPILDQSGEIEEWFGVANDITARKEIERTRNQLAAIVESADDAIISKDLNSVVTSWNPGAVRLFGFSAEEMIGQSIRRIIPDDLQHEEDMILENIRSGRKIEHYETVRWKKGGERVEVSVTISPVRDADGQVVGASKIARNISERNNLERVLIQSEKLAATGRMAATVAHELNNPLEAIVNLVYLAHTSCSGNAEAEHLLKIAEKELQRLSHITRKTLGFYRDTLNPKLVSISELLDSLIDVYEAKLNRDRISVERSYQENEPVLARTGELQQVFSNLISNSIDAMAGGGTLQILINSETREAKRGISIIIRDSGCGISPANLSRVFEPFFTTKGELGTGIGLWVSRQLVQMQGGKIHLESTARGEKRGTAAFVFLPYVSD